MRPGAPGPTPRTQAPFSWTEWAARSRKEKERTQDSTQTKTYIRDKVQGRTVELNVGSGKTEAETPSIGGPRDQEAPETIPPVLE